MNTVLITAYQRPEFLWLCLEHIVRSYNYNKNYYIINLDHGFRRINLDVVKAFTHKFEHLEVNHTPNIDIPRATKQSHAVLEGYRLAQSKSDNLVFMIEEDVMIADYFFDWHEAVHQLESDIYCSIGTRNNNTRHKPIEDYSKYHLQSGDYQSLGVCFKKDRLNEVLVHASINYYRNPWAYCQSNWPKSNINPNFVEQDGLHRRVMGQQQAAFSFDGFAFHAGFYGYNRKSANRVTGTLPQKVEKVREIAFNPTKLKQAVLNAGYDLAYYYDSEPITLKTNWNGKLDKILI